MSNLGNGADRFSGLPAGILIEGPLRAACRAQVMLDPAVTDPGAAPEGAMGTVSGQKADQEDAPTDSENRTI